MTIWIVLTVAPQRERRVHDDIQRELGLLACLPSVQKFRKALGKGDKPVLVPYLVPLLPGYVFAGSGGPFPLHAIKSRGFVSGFVQFDGTGPRTLSDAEVDRMRILARTATVETPGTYRPGEVVRINKGPFESLQTLISEIRGGEVRIKVRMLGKDTDHWLTADAIDKAA